MIVRDQQILRSTACHIHYAYNASPVTYKRHTQSNQVLLMWQAVAQKAFYLEPLEGRAGGLIMTEAGSNGYFGSALDRINMVVREQPWNLMCTLRDTDRELVLGRMGSSVSHFFLSLSFSLPLLAFSITRSCLLCESLLGIHKAPMENGQ